MRFGAYRVSKLAEIDLDRVRSRGYSFQEEILFWCQTVGCRIGETPILFENRRARRVEDQHARSRLGALDPRLQLGVARMDRASRRNARIEIACRVHDRLMAISRSRTVT